MVNHFAAAVKPAPKGVGVDGTGETTLRQMLSAEPSQALYVEHGDYSVCHLDQPRFLQCAQGLIDALPRRTDEMTKLFVGDWLTGILPGGGVYDANERLAHQFRSVGAGIGMEFEVFAGWLRRFLWIDQLCEHGRARHCPAIVAKPAADVLSTPKFDR